MPPHLRLRALDDGDLAAVLALNEGDVQHLSPLDERRLAELLPWCTHAAVVVDDADDRAVLGFVLTLAPGTPYDSPNYRWFDSRLDAFLYLDRIVVAPTARRRGVASFVYDVLEASARDEHHGRLVCEVDVEPPNDASLRFHRSRGFVELGRHGANGKVVALLGAP
jgi:predicted GNAT superfamily acetyltransferase